MWTGIVLETYMWTSIVVGTYMWTSIVLGTYMWTSIILETYMWTSIVLGTYMWTGIVLETYMWQVLYLGLICGQVLYLYQDYCWNDGRLSKWQLSPSPYFLVHLWTFYLDRCFHGHWFGERSAQHWLYRSPELNTLHFYVLSMSKSGVPPGSILHCTIQLCKLQAVLSISTWKDMFRVLMVILNMYC